MATPSPPHPESVLLPRTMPSLTSLRAFAALLVFLSHQAVTIGFGPVGGLLARGWIGVSFFFVLSGFLLGWGFRPGKLSARAFWRRRFARVYPSHFVVFVLAFPFLLLPLSAGLVLPGLANLLLVQAWIPERTVYFGFTGVAWSLSCEAFFYAVFPFVALLLARLPRRNRWIVIGVLFGAGVVVELLGTRTQGMDLFFYVNPLVRLPEFLLGIGLALEIRAGWRPVHARRWLLLGAGLPFTACVLIWELGPNRRGFTMWIAVLGFAAIIVAAVASDLGGGTRFMRSRVMQRLGELSFCFYLVHVVVLTVTGRYFGHELFKVPLDFALALVIAWGVNVLVERPFEKRLSGRLPAQAASRRDTWALRPRERWALRVDRRSEFPTEFRSRPGPVLPHRDPPPHADGVEDEREAGGAPDRSTPAAEA